MRIEEVGRCQRLVMAELRRLGNRGIGIHDQDDLQQELITVALRASERADGATAYVRLSVRNAIKHLYREMHAQRRCPTDSSGASLPLVYGYEAHDGGTSPETHALLRVGARACRDRLPLWSQEVLDRVLAGDAEIPPNRIDDLCGQIRRCGGTTMTDAYSIPAPPEGEITACHADGAEPEGYNPAEVACQDCIDKFSCLPRAREKNLIQTPLEVDVEVSAVIARTMTYREAAQRVWQRDQLRRADKVVPAELWPLAPEPTKPPKKLRKPTAGAPECELPGTPTSEVAPETPASPAAPEPAAPKRKLRKRTPEEKEKPQIKRTKRLEPRPKTKAPTRALPAPSPISNEAMVAAMSRIRLGKPVALDYGWQIVKRGRDGTEHVVTLRENGFEFRGQLYNSLTQCAVHACGWGYRSGNDYFSLVTSRQTEVRDPDGKVVARGGM